MNWASIASIAGSAFGIVMLAFISFQYGKVSEKNRKLENDAESKKESEQRMEQIKELSDDDANKLLDKWVR